MLRIEKAAGSQRRVPAAPAAVSARCWRSRHCASPPCRAHDLGHRALRHRRSLPLVRTDVAQIEVALIHACLELDKFTAAVLILRIGNAGQCHIGGFERRRRIARHHHRLKFARAIDPQRASPVSLSSATRSASPKPGATITRHPCVNRESVTIWPCALTIRPLPYSTERASAANGGAALWKRRERRSHGDHHWRDDAFHRLVVHAMVKPRTSPLRIEARTENRFSPRRPLTK